MIIHVQSQNEGALDGPCASDVCFTNELHYVCVHCTHTSTHIVTYNVPTGGLDFDMKSLTTFCRPPPSLLPISLFLSASPALSRETLRWMLWASPRWTLLSSPRWTLLSSPQWTLLSSPRWTLFSSLRWTLLD